MKGVTALLAAMFFLLSVFIHAQQKIIDSLERELILSTNGLSKVEVLNEISWYYAHSDTKKGIEKSDEAIALAIKNKDSLQLGIAYERKGYNYQNKGKDSLTVLLYNKAEDVYRRIDHKNRLAALNFNKSNFYLFRSDYQKSLDQVQKAYNIFEGNQDTLRMGRAYNLMGLNHLYLGDYTSTLKAFQKGALFFELTNNKETQFYAEIQGNVALLYEKLTEYETALEFQKKALEIHKKIDYQLGVANTYNNIGKLYGLLNQHEKAIDVFNASMLIKEKMGNKYRIANGLTNLGITYYELKQYPKAVSNFKKAKSIYLELNHFTNLSSVYKNIGDIYLDEGQTEIAEIQFDSAIYYAEKAKDKRAIYVAKEGLAKSAFANSNFKRAYTEQQEALAVRESMLSNEKRDELAEIKAKYEYEKEKAILKADFDKNKAIDEAEIKQQVFIRNASIGVGVFSIAMLAIGFTMFRRKKEADLNTKIVTSKLQTLRAQMNPHFIFNTLNSINDYILQNKKDVASHYLTQFSKMMRKILDNSKKEEVPLNEEIEFLENYIKLEQQRLANKFTYSIKVHDSINTEETLVPPSLFQPFIENSIWHGLSEKKESDGLIVINFNKEHSTLICVIDDNGTGMNKIENKNLNRKSFGISGAQSRLDLLNKLKGTNAKINFINKSKGVRVEIRLPLSLET